MGWRDWNQYQCAISQDIMEGVMRAMVDRSRTVNGVPMSLADLGYSDVGLDDCWQACGSYGPQNYTYHDPMGNPIVDVSIFPSLKSMTDYGHSLNLTVGWYGNNCKCSDHCSNMSCYQGDVNALLAYGFDSVKLDGCGAEYDLNIFADLITAAGKAITLENCHWGGTVPNATWCPFNFYRSSLDARPTYGSVLYNINSVPPLAAANLSTPGCWAYPDMLEVGVTNTQSAYPPMSYVEARSNFGAWCIVSSPLILGLNVTDGPTMDSVWDIISNTEAIAVNQDYVGFSGTMFAQASINATFNPCTWPWIVPNCSYPIWQHWYKPLSANKTAVLLMNNAEYSQDLTFSFSDVPGLSGTATYQVRDIWAHEDVGTFTGSYTAAGLVSHDSAFLVLSPSGAA